MERDKVAACTLMFVIGVAVGAAVGLLTAPQAGRRTRREIVRRAENAQTYLEDLGEELIERGREMMERGKEMAEGKIKELGQKVRQATA
ncbi:MAG: YtxH domain-containing protein [Bryobacteraceae bacterium]|nr:YtxH domain-containing protein [Bryobacteraceae bacterium]